MANFYRWCALRPKLEKIYLRNRVLLGTFSKHLFIPLVEMNHCHKNFSKQFRHRDFEL